ncbi:SRPBCC domain-containing protein [Nocardiopsis sp. MG754419]|uniref:SRPBCC domain-containing protein n=1 Tax=Nocardiopsis sp. MG754419 TaxID=2259865 RepID=UPI001BACBBCF|nr:SRPBCC domain-containing protein [Nocardiopsis sp. MG754419]MBR8740293.1 ATPase [Nocardiopsis sp. MG754419]
MSERVDRAERRIAAPRPEVYRALVTPESLLAWLPPEGMTARFERFDASGYRMVLTYGESGHGKSSEDTDVVETEFVKLVPDERVVQRIVFAAEDPAFAGVMTMRWSLSDVAEGTLVTIEARDVPPGISPDDHRTGLTSSLANLATHLGRPTAP